MKPFLTYDQQVAKLRSKGLSVPNEDAAKATLADIGYFSLVNGYKRPLRDPSTRRYKPGASFEDVVALYEFDRSLRELFLHNLTWVERKLKSAASYAFCDRHGAAQAAYLDKLNYSPLPKHRSGIDTLVNRIMEPLARRNVDHEYLVHYRGAHGEVPLWVLTCALTFGQVSKMYSFMAPADRAVTAKQFEGLNERELGQFVRFLVFYRNVCAHGELLFCHREHSDIPDTPLHAKLSIRQVKGAYSSGKRDLFAVVIALRYLLPAEEFRTFKGQLASLIDRFVRNNDAVEEGELLSLMGFPGNWKKVSTYRKR